MENILVIGAGQLGSRHLQSLRNVPTALNIVVFDPSAKSLEVAKGRFEDGPAAAKHQVSYHTSLDEVKTTQFKACVMANSSDTRSVALKAAVAKFEIQNFLMEKILFDTHAQYAEAKTLLGTKSKAWVNVCMRMQTAYYELRSQLAGQPFQYRVTGSTFGLVTNAIHYLDHALFLNGSPEFRTDTSKLLPKVIEAKRPGFMELEGELNFQFAKGSTLEINCYPSGNTPVLIEVMAPNVRFISRENENKYWISSAENGWKWEEKPLEFKYQSGLTQIFVGDILAGREPVLPRFEEASATHLGLLQPLKEFIAKQGYKGAKEYPFT